jgi:hypothetical protein
MKRNKVLTGVVVMGIAVALVFAGCGKKDSGGRQANAGSGGTKTVEQLVSVLDKVLAASDKDAAIEAAAVFADLLKTATAQDLTSLNAKASPGGDFFYDLNEAGDGIIITGYTGANPVMIIPTEIEGYPVIELGENAFGVAVTAAVIPENVQKINWGAFNGSFVRAVTFPSSLTVIDAYAFAGCKRLRAVNFPSNLTVIGERAFTSVSLSELDLSHTSLTRIEATAFVNCDQLKTVKLPDSVTVIESGAFAGCPALTDINIPASIQIIGASPSDSRSLYSQDVGGVFNDCIELYNLTIPDSVTNIKFLKDAEGNVTDFNGCGKLPIAIRKRLQNLGYTGAF